MLPRAERPRAPRPRVSMTPSLPTKHGRSPGVDRLFLAPVIAAFVVIVCGFVVATVYSEFRASAIDREALLIEVNALPSVEYLAAARGALWHLEAAARRYVDEPGTSRTETDSTIASARKEVDRELALAFATELYPEEGELQAHAGAAMKEVDRLVALTREAASRSEA